MCMVHMLYWVDYAQVFVITCKFFELVYICNLLMMEDHANCILYSMCLLSEAQESLANQKLFTIFVY